MATYLELKAQAEKLMAQAEEMRDRERNQAIEDIKSRMQALGLTPQDLGFGRLAGDKTRGARKSGPAAKSAAKYRGPNDETWSGGRGRKPKWVQEALAAGKRIEDFAI